MTTTTESSTLQRHLDILSLISDGELVDMVRELPADRQSAAAALLVRQVFPIREAILAAADADLPSVVSSLVTESTR